MAERSEIQNTLGGTQFGTALKDLADGDLSRGYFDASPLPQNTEGYMAGEVHVIDDLEGEGFRRTHGRYDEYGFVRRPTSRGDVERN